MGASLKGLISLAYGIPMDRIIGTAKWLDTDRLDVIAKAPATAPFQSLRGMLKTLIVQRFKVTSHNEDQSMPVYVLAPGKKPQLKDSDGATRSECKIIQKE